MRGQHHASPIGLPLALLCARVHSNLVFAEMETAGIEPASAVAYEWLLRA